MAPAVQLRQVVALGGRFPALAGVDLDVDPGEVVVLVGPNGAGKTSLLRTCAGLLPVTSGRAMVLGHDLRSGTTEVRRHVGLLGHVAPLYEELSAVENVRFAVRAVRAPASGVDRSLDRLGLTGRLRKTPVGRLSAGQRRRVSLAMLVARAPRLWLLDEPHAALDADARRLLGQLIAEATTSGGAVLLSSHEREVAEEFGDRVAVMVGGRIVDDPAGAAPEPGGEVPDAPPAERLGEAGGQAAVVTAGRHGDHGPTGPTASDRWGSHVA